MGTGFPRGIVAGLTLALCLGTATAAQAQHVVTEAEAAKLTLAALTAPPPPPRPIYRAYVRRAMARSYVIREGGWGRRERYSTSRSMTRVSERHLVRHGGGVVHARLHRR